jgi:crotonobetainyl-CoA:carnitine CoA-transferase CaiB-like acyl-CoA transferase
MTASRGALAGVRVVDASRVLAGPYAAMLLADLGADVVKIEAPGGGDDTRTWGPPFDAGGMSAYFLAVNRGKRSAAIDLATEDGRRALDDLLAGADVLIENFKSSTREAFGLTAEAMRSRHPRLVHVAISGWGAEGAYAARPGYDAVAQAASGLMSITGEAAGEPQKVGVAVSDLAAGLHAAVALLAALRHRDATGAGQFVDVSLFDASLALLVNVASAALLTGEPALRWGNAHPAIVPYQTVAAADGRLMLAVGNDLQFRALAAVLGVPSWADDPRFATNPERVGNRGELLPMIEERIKRRPVAHWLAALESAGVPAGPVRTVGEALASPEAAQRGIVVSLPRPGLPPVSAVGPVPRLSRTPARAGAAPPRVGQHTAEILREWAGYEDVRIEALRASGAIA